MIRLLKKSSSLILVLVIYSCFMLVNCVLTGSPYSAWHSGKVGAYASSTAFTFNIAYVLAFTIILAFLVKGLVIYKKNPAYILCLIILLSGIITGNIFVYSNTYLFDVILILLSSTLAVKDAHSRFDDKEFDNLSKYIFAMTVLGLLLLVVGNGRFGFVTLEFSRNTRGEVTWWVILFLPALLVAITLIKMLRKDKAFIYVALSLIAFVIVLSTSSRTTILLFLVLLAIYFFSLKLTPWKLLLSLCAIVALGLGWTIIWNFFSLGSNSLDTILNGRFGLWKVYWNAFMERPFIGYGPGVYINESVGAFSEIGLLKNVTHYGIFFGVAFLIIVVKGIKNAIGMIKNITEYEKFDVLVLMMFFVGLITILQQHARILQFSDFLCWYSIFYMASIDGRSIITRND